MIISSSSFKEQHKAEVIKAGARGEYIEIFFDGSPEEDLTLIAFVAREHIPFYNKTLSRSSENVFFHHSAISVKADNKNSTVNLDNSMQVELVHDEYMVLWSHVDIKGDASQGIQQLIENWNRILNSPRCATWGKNAEITLTKFKVPLWATLTTVYCLLSYGVKSVQLSLPDQHSVLKL